MVVAQKIKEFLEQCHVEYKSLVHPTAYTAQEVAAATHIKGKEIAKCVIIKADNKLIMAVLPATRKVDMKKVKDLLSVKKVELATEEEFKAIFPDCEIGAQPPFGNLYQVDVLAAQLLWESTDITFNAGTHNDVITMHLKDWEELVHPQQANFTEPL